MQKKACSLIISVILLLTSWISIAAAESTSAPIADAGGPYTGTIGTPIQFDGSNSYTPNGTISSYEWFCGDGTVKTGVSPSHTYTHPGTYTLTLTVKDEMNNCGTDTTQVVINEDQKPTASFQQPEENNVYFRDIILGSTDTAPILIGPCTIIVEAEDDIGIDHVEFFVDDKSMYSDENAPFEWTWKTGHLMHTLKAVVTDSSGQTTEIEQDVFKWRLHPLLILSAISLGSKNQDNDLFSWNPTRNNDDNHALILLTLLRYILQNDNPDSDSLFTLLQHLLTSEDEDNSPNLAQFLEDHPLIKRRIENKYPLIYRLIMLSSDTSPDNRLFTNDNMLIRSIFLALLTQRLSTDDTSFFERNNPPLIEGGSFTTWLKDHPLFTISSALLLLMLLQRMRNRNNDDDDSIDDTIQNKDPVARTGGPYTGVIGETITFSAKNSYDDDGTIVSFNWDFGDGKTGSGESTTHTYLATGTYTIILTVTDDNGASTNDTTTITINEFVEDSSDSEPVANAEFWIIAGGLSSLLAVGLAVLNFRRRLFE
jgi:PKD repeat protein